MGLLQFFLRRDIILRKLGEKKLFFFEALQRFCPKKFSVVADGATCHHR